MFQIVKLLQGKQDRLFHESVNIYTSLWKYKNNEHVKN